MSILGYLRTQLTTARMRFVTPGHNADDPATPANAVIFDSDANEYLQVYVSGTLNISADNGAILQVASWPSLGYIPFVYSSWRPNDGFVVGGFATQNPFPVAPSDSPGVTVKVAADGLWADTGGFTAIGYPLFLDYIVFRKTAS